MSNTKEFISRDYGDYSVSPWGKSFELDVEYRDFHYGLSSTTLDALEVYRNLKEYFKGTEYE